MQKVRSFTRFDKHFISNWLLLLAPPLFMQDSILILTFGGGKGLQPQDSRLQYVQDSSDNWKELDRIEKTSVGCGCGIQAVAKYIVEPLTNDMTLRERKLFTETVPHSIYYSTI